MDTSGKTWREDLGLAFFMMSDVEELQICDVGLAFLAPCPADGVETT
jgi:hypothetical protein